MGGHGIREKEGREGDLTMESAEHKEEARVQKFFTSKAEALQRLYRKEQLELKYQAEYLQTAPVPTQMHAPSAFPSAASAEHPSVARYDSYRARQKQRMERAFAHAQEKHAQHEEGVDGEESERREPAQGQREVGVAHRRRVVELEPAAERDVWSSETQRDIMRVEHARAKPELYGYQRPLKRQQLAASPLVGEALATTPAAERSSVLTWPMVPRRHPQGAFKDKTVYDKDYSWPSTSEVVEGDEWQRKGDCGMFGANC